MGTVSTVPRPCVVDPTIESQEWAVGDWVREMSEGQLSRRSGSAPVSCREYERLMAGETASWSQIVREHPMLGEVTVTTLVKSGAVRVMPEYDPATGQTEFRLCRVEPVQRCLEERGECQEIGYT